MDSAIADAVFHGTIQDALLLDDKVVTHTVLIDGVQVDGLESRVTHGKASPVGSADLLVAVEDMDRAHIGATVEIQAGYGSAVGTIFRGRFYEDFTTGGDDGDWARCVAYDDTQKLVAPSRRPVQFPIGKISIKEVFESLCDMRNVDNYYADNTVGLNNTTVLELAGVTLVDDGRLIIPKDQGLLQWMNSKFGMFGYYVYGAPGNIVRLSRMTSPPPVGSEVATYAEQQHVPYIERSRRPLDIINDWEIIGVTYKDEETGEETSIRTFPLTVANEPLLSEPFYAHAEIKDDLIVTLELAEEVRGAQEIRTGRLSPGWKWLTEGDPERSPGDPVRIIKPVTGDDEMIWLENITQTVSDEGYWADMDGTAGQGAPLPAGDDCVFFPMLTGQTVHLGNEFLPNYRVPAANGNNGRYLHKIPFTVPDVFSSLTMIYFAHGTNNLVSGEIKASRFEVHQGSPMEKVAEGELPRQPESLTIRYGVGYDQNWTRVPLPLSGSLKPGPAELHIISGNADDFEIRDATLRACGAGSPVYPDEGET